MATGMQEDINQGQVSFGACQSTLRRNVAVDPVNLARRAHRSQSNPSWPEWVKQPTQAQASPHLQVPVASVHPSKSYSYSIVR